MLKIIFFYFILNKFQGLEIKFLLINLNILKLQTCFFICHSESVQHLYTIFQNPMLFYLFQLIHRMNLIHNKLFLNFVIQEPVIFNFHWLLLLLLHLWTQLFYARLFSCSPSLLLYDLCVGQSPELLISLLVIILITTEPLNQFRCETLLIQYLQLLILLLTPV